MSKQKENKQTNKQTSKQTNKQKPTKHTHTHANPNKHQHPPPQANRRRTHASSSHSSTRTQRNLNNTEYHLRKSMFFQIIKQTKSNEYHFNNMRKSLIRINKLLHMPHNNTRYRLKNMSKPMVGWLISNWIFTSCQPHRVTSRRKSMVLVGTHKHIQE